MSARKYELIQVREDGTVVKNAWFESFGDAVEYAKFMIGSEFCCFAQSETSWELGETNEDGDFVVRYEIYRHRVAWGNFARRGNWTDSGK